VIIVRPGDVDGDGIVSACDAQIVASAVENQTPVPIGKFDAYDANRDGVFNSADKLALMNGGIALMGTNRCDAVGTDESVGMCSVGDIDGNGVVDHYDVDLLENMLKTRGTSDFQAERDSTPEAVAFKDTKPASRFVTADMDRNGKVNFLDLSILKSMISPCSQDDSPMRLNFFATAQAGNAVPRFNCNNLCGIGTTNHCGPALVTDSDNRLTKTRIYCGPTPAISKCFCWDGTRNGVEDGIVIERPQSDLETDIVVIYYNRLKFSQIDQNKTLQSKVVSDIAEKMQVNPDAVTVDAMSTGGTRAIVQIELPSEKILEDEYGGYESFSENETAQLAYKNEELQRLRQSVSAGVPIEVDGEIYASAASAPGGDDGGSSGTSATIFVAIGAICGVVMLVAIVAAKRRRKGTGDNSGNADELDEAIQMDILDSVLKDSSKLDSKGFHAIHYAIARGDIAALARILDESTDMNTTDTAGFTRKRQGSQESVPAAPPTPDLSEGTRSPVSSTRSSGSVTEVESARSSGENLAILSPPDQTLADATNHILSPSSPILLDARIDSYLDDVLRQGELANPAVNFDGGGGGGMLQRSGSTEIDLDQIEFQPDEPLPDIDALLGSSDIRPLAGGGGSFMPTDDVRLSIPQLDAQPKDEGLTHTNMLNLRDAHGATPAAWACRSGHKGALELLLARGANVTIPNHKGQTPLHFLCLLEPIDLSMVNIVLEQRMVDPDARDLEGRTPLGYCVMKQQVEAVHALLGHGANPCIQDSQGGCPLILAVQNGDLGIVHTLLPAPGSDITVRDDQGWTLLHWAAAVGNQDVLAFLLSLSGLSPEWTNHDGETCLHVAARQGHLGVLTAVCNSISKTKLRNVITHERDDGLTAADVASAEGFPEVAALFETLYPKEELPPGPVKLDPADFATKEDRARARRKEYMRRKRAEAKEAKEKASASVARLREEQLQLDLELQAARAEAATLRSMLSQGASPPRPVSRV